MSHGLVVRCIGCPFGGVLCTVGCGVGCPFGWLAQVSRYIHMPMAGRRMIAKERRLYMVGKSPCFRRLSYTVWSVRIVKACFKKRLVQDLQFTHGPTDIAAGTTVMIG